MHPSSRLSVPTSSKCLQRPAVLPHIHALAFAPLRRPLPGHFPGWLPGALKAERTLIDSPRAQRPCPGISFMRPVGLAIPRRWNAKWSAVCSAKHQSPTKFAGSRSSRALAPIVRTASVAAANSGRFILPSNKPVRGRSVSVRRCSSLIY